MKRVTKFLLAGSLLFTTFAQTGCFGEFALVRKVYNGNKNISSSGVVQSLVMYVFMFLPVYAFAGFVDIILFNLIEFWTGSNPLAMNEGDMEKQEINYAGVNYEMTATKNQFSVKILDGKDAGKTLDLVYTPKDASWSATADGKTVKVCEVIETENGETMARLFLPNGESKDFPVNDNSFALVQNYAAEYSQVATK